MLSRSWRVAVAAVRRVGQARFTVGGDDILIGPFSKCSAGEWISLQVGGKSGWAGPITEVVCRCQLGETRSALPRGSPCAVDAIGSYGHAEASVPSKTAVVLTRVIYFAFCLRSANFA